ncbi:MAG TPA: HEAT repeat domain-containing protein [Smithellaceae bacterium]|nr:HEAT repeat domain-containing protein [Smithellaceae bacterium]
MKLHFIAKFVCAIALITFLTGCSLSYTIKEPVPSRVKYENANIASVTLTIVDQRKDTDAVFILERLGAGSEMKEGKVVKFDNLEDPILYFARNLEREMNSRNIPVKCVLGKSASEGFSLLIHKYQIANTRATGFSPWESFHIFSATIVKNGQTKNIKAYFYNGKVPVWSMDEIQEPCFNIPMSIIIKDVASKISNYFFNLRVADDKVSRLSDEINAEIEKNDFGAFWKVLELGYTNNHQATSYLRKYARMGDEFFKSCAVSAIGMLGGEEDIEFLKQSYKEGWYNDRYMAIKAIGDIGTPNALQFIQTLRKEPVYEKEDGLKYCVELYAP